jgi:hypothetical protein
MKYGSAALALLLSISLASAQGVSPARVGITPTTDPETVSIRDNANHWVTIGTMTGGVFTPVAGGGSNWPGTCDPGLARVPCLGTMPYVNAYFPSDGLLPNFASPPTVNIGTAAAGGVGLDSSLQSILTYTRPFTPDPVNNIAPFTATSVASNISIPAGNTTLILSSASNTTNILHCRLGASAVNSDQTIQPGSWFAFYIGSNTQFSCVTSAGSQIVTAVVGTGGVYGSGGGGGGGGGGAVTIAAAADVSEGNITDTAWTLTGNSTVVQALKALGLANGTIGDAAWSGTGNSSEVAALKAISLSAAQAVTGINAGYDATTNSTRTSRVSLYPLGAVPITASTIGTTAATTATLAGVAAKTTYICGMSIRANASGAITGNSTVTGTISGTLNFMQWTAPAANGIGVTEQMFSPCVPASAVNTGIAVISAAPGTGGNVSVSAWGYQL